MIRKFIIIFVFFLFVALALAATLNLSVSASANDGTETTTANNIIGTRFIRGYTATNSRWAGARFLSVTIPGGATINSAALQLNFVTGSLVLDVTIYCEAADNAATYTTTFNNISSRARSSSSTEWDIASTTTGYVSSSDFSAALQEVVNRAGWASGNAVSVIFSINSNNTAECYGWDDAGATEPKLYITYTVGGRRVRKIITY